jgi:hypothetical protein
MEEPDLSPYEDDGEENEEPEGYSIESSEAYVACVQSSCWQCGADIDVVAIYCGAATFDGEPFNDCTVINITDTDEAFGAQLAPWPFFRKDEGVFCNVCPHCDTPQEETDLHCEPEGAFFRMDAATREAMTMTRLAGTIRLNGEETVG